MKTLLTAFILCLCLRATAPASELSLSGGANAASTNPSLASVSLPASPDLAGSNANWMGAANGPSLTLDTPKAPSSVAQLDLSLPTATSTGVPDSWVYAALGLILLGLGWACSGSLSRQKSAPVPYDDDRRTARPQRVRMLPLR